MVPDYIGDGKGDQEEIMTAICDGIGQGFDGTDCDGVVTGTAEVTKLCLSSAPPIAHPLVCMYAFINCVFFSFGSEALEVFHSLELVCGDFNTKHEICFQAAKTSGAACSQKYQRAWHRLVYYTVPIK